MHAHAVAPHVHGRLVPGRDVGRGRVVQVVDAAQDPQIGARELVALVTRQLREVGGVAARREVHLDGPARGERHVREPVLGLEHDARPRLLEVDDALEQVGSLALDLLQQAGRARGHVGVRVDLAVGVVQRHADLLAAILEREHLLDTRKR